MTTPINRNAAAITEWDEARLDRLKESYEAARQRYADTGETTFRFDDLELNVQFVKHMLPWAYQQLEKLNGSKAG